MKGYAAIVRPWLKAGINVLLVENEARVLELRAKAEAPAGAVQEPREAQAVASAVRPAGPASVPAGFPVPPKPSPTPLVRAPRQPAQKVEPVSPPPSVPAPKAPSPRRSGQSLLAVPGALPVERWPASWMALKNRRPLPSRPLVLWSYAGLGDDLMGTPDEARRRVIVRMLTELRHPAGTHVFWPFALPGEEPSARASLFWSGVGMLDPRVLLLFGSDTRDALAMPRTLLPFCQERVYGRLVIQLPRPQALAEDEAAFRQAQAFLSRILRFCAAR